MDPNIANATLANTTCVAYGDLTKKVNDPNNNLYVKENPSVPRDEILLTKSTLVTCNVEQGAANGMVADQ